MIIPIIAVIATFISLLAGIGAERLREPVEVAGHFVQLTLSHNAGIAFGIAIPYPLQEVLIGIALLAVLLCAFRSKQSPMNSLAFGLIIGGAVANLLDRLPDGIVTDFIAVGSFPIFNLADACITIGAGIVLMESMVKKKERSIIGQ